MKKLLPLLLILPVLPMPLPGAVDDKVVEYLRPDEARIAPDGERFLFVVETTSHTQRMEAGCRQTAFDLVFTGVSEQMRTGDTFGVWTFNDEVHTGKFPMTVWDSAQTLELAGRVSGFLKDQKYSHRPNMEALVLSLRSVTEQTGDLNVFLLSSGREPIVGTPYDEGINAAYETLSKQRSRAGRPLITMFVVRKGRVVAASVAIPGDRITLPPRPPSNRPSPTNGVAVASVKRTSSPEGSSTNSTLTKPKKVMQIVTKSNPPAPSVVTAPTAEPTNRVDSPAVTTTLASTPPASDSSVATEAPSRTATSPQRASSPAAESDTAVAPAPSPNANPAPAEPVQSDRSPAKPIVDALTEGLTPAPLTVVARESGTARAADVTAESAATDPSPADPPSQSELQAVAVPQPELSPVVMLAIGGVLLAMSTLLLVLVLRRTSSGIRTSLITESMERRS